MLHANSPPALPTGRQVAGRRQVGICFNKMHLMNQILLTDEMSMLSETPTGMINSYMRITCVSTNFTK